MGVSPQVVLFGALAAAASFQTPAAAASFQRESVSFNFGWRFHNGDAAGAAAVCPAADYDETLNASCTETFYVPVHSAADCQKACCPGSGYHPACSVWTWCEANDPAHWKENVTCGCYLGQASSVCGAQPSAIKWSGGRRNTHWKPTQGGEFSTAAFNDSAWALINTPHDFVIEREFSANATDGGKHGYLPREQPGWYRKHFQLPEAWANRTDIEVWLRFNGVFHTSAAYLDGTRLALGRGSKSGYTAFSAALPPGLGPGEHVLAIRVDASFGSGHWYEGGGESAQPVPSLQRAFRAGRSRRASSVGLLAVAHLSSTPCPLSPAPPRPTPQASTGMLPSTRRASAGSSRTGCSRRPSAKPPCYRVHNSRSATVAKRAMPKSNSW